jgi:hypothetical protein
MRHDSTEEGAAVQPEQEGSSRIWSTVGPALADPQSLRCRSHARRRPPCEPAQSGGGRSNKPWSAAVKEFRNRPTATSMQESRAAAARQR